ncbi:MAG: metallophosphoesterase family protein [Candidatus Cryptobacteroides sp.]
MKRREFLATSAASIAGLAFGGSFLTEGKSRDKKYSVVILGDTHFDTEPASVYHSDYNEPVEWLNRVQREEFARNGEMWRERCPKLLKRAACLIDDDTRMVLQMGDLIQGDCGNPLVHKKMLADVMDRFKGELCGLPFVTVVGNHDIRGTGAENAYKEYMPARMSSELGKEISKTTFSFNIGDDAFIVIDFNRPDDAEVEKLLEETEGARNTFIVIHGPLLPFDGGSCRWFFHGAESQKHTDARRHFRELFARRNVICLCGHTHSTELADWYGDGGRITQMTMNSVWSKEEYGIYTVKAEGAGEYGKFRMAKKTMPDGSPVKDESALFEEYRPGLKRYVNSNSAGSYKMTVSGRRVIVDFYAGDSTRASERFVLRP